MNQVDAIYTRHMDAMQVVSDTFKRLDGSVYGFSMRLALSELAAAMQRTGPVEDGDYDYQQKLMDVAGILKRRATAHFDRFGWDFVRAIDALLDEHAEQIDRLEGKLAGAETENRQLNDMLTRIERVLESHDSALYADVVADKTKLSTAVDALVCSYEAAFAAFTADVERYDRHQAQLRTELDALRRQLATANADNTFGAMIVSAAGHYPTPILTADEANAQTTNGHPTPDEISVVIVPAAHAEGKVSVWAQPGMLDFLDPETKDYWDGITAGRWTWRKLPKRTRLAMVRHVLSFGPDPGDMTQAQFDAMKPSWMPPGAAHPGSFGVSWSQLNDLRVEVAV